MILISSDTPEADRAAVSDFLRSPSSVPVTMLNLLKFRERAAYDDEPSGLSGREAYAIYAAEMERLVNRSGGRYVYVGVPTAALIGSSESWDLLAVVEYPSRAAFRAIVESPEYAAIAGHRAAGLDTQVLIATHGGYETLGLTDRSAQ